MQQKRTALFLIPLRVITNIRIQIQILRLIIIVNVLLVICILLIKNFMLLYMILKQMRLLAYSDFFIMIQVVEKLEFIRTIQNLLIIFPVVSKMNQLILIFIMLTKKVIRSGRIIIFVHFSFNPIIRILNFHLIL